MMNNVMINKGNMDNNFNVKEINENPEITIYVRKRDNPTIMIKCSKKDKVSDAIKKYRIESGDDDETVRLFLMQSNCILDLLLKKQV